MLFKLLTNDGETIIVRDKAAKIIARGDTLELYVGDRCYFDIQEITVEEAKCKWIKRSRKEEEGK